MIVTDRWIPFKACIHLRPSRWDRSPKSLKASLNASAFDNATVILLTEVADGKRPKALRQWANINDWNLLHDTEPWQSGETAILAHVRTWSVIDWATVNIGPDLGPGLPVVCTIAILKHRITGVTALVSVSHLPSAVESIWSVKGAKRIIAYRRMVVRYRKVVSAWRKEFKPDFEAVSADWNLDVLKAWVRAYLKSAFPKHKLVYSRKGGTHGPRQIDAFLLRKVKGNSSIMQAHRSSDHRATELLITRVNDG